MHLPRMANSLVRRLVRRRRPGGPSPRRPARALRPSAPAPSPARCTARLSGQRRLPPGSPDLRRDRNHAPAVAHERGSRFQITALLVRNGDEMPRRRAFPEPHLTTELQVHPIRIRASQFQLPSAHASSRPALAAVFDIRSWLPLLVRAWDVTIELFPRPFVLQHLLIASLIDRQPEHGAGRRPRADPRRRVAERDDSRRWRGAQTRR